MIFAIGVGVAPSKAAAAVTEEQYMALLDRGLDSVIEEIRASAERHDRKDWAPKFSANLVLAHGAFIRYFPLEMLIAYVDGLKEAGVDRIDISPGLFPWRHNNEENIAKYDALIAHIRELGLELALNPEFNRGELDVGRFADWEREALPVYAELARRYRPDVFVVIHEPTTMAARMGIGTTPRQWRRFVQSAAGVVTAESPSTRIGAGALATERRFFREWLTLPEVDLIGLDIYSLRHLETYNQMIRTARGHGKAVYIEETWRFPYQGDNTAEGPDLETMSARSIGSERYQRLDAKWLECLVLYASAWQLEAVTPFWTQTFFAYVQEDLSGLDWHYNRRVGEAAVRGERTDLFRKYQELIRTLQANAR